MPSVPSLIITLTLDKNSQEFFSRLRNENFPGHCNFLEAHVTMFHRLPANVPVIFNELEVLTKRRIMELQVTGIKNTGKGVSYSISSPELQGLHKNMQKAFAPYLISKDRNKLRAHITVQNMVTAYKARLTEEKLLLTFEPFTIQGIGISAWIYKNGPWEHVKDFLFAT